MGSTTGKGKAGCSSCPCWLRGNRKASRKLVFTLRPLPHIRLWARRLALVCWPRASRWRRRGGTEALTGGKMPLAARAGCREERIPLLRSLTALASSAIWPFSGLGCGPEARSGVADGLGQCPRRAYRVPDALRLRMARRSEDPLSSLPCSQFSKSLQAGWGDRTHQEENAVCDQGQMRVQWTEFIPSVKKH